MADADSFFEREFRVPVMAIFRGLDVERSVELAITAWDLGIDVVEVPIQSDTDLEALATIAALARERGKVAGSGTVLHADHVRQSVEAGAMFTVSPSLNLDVVRASLDAGLPALPGVATPTEVAAATAFGLTWLKAFPAISLGPAWFRTVRGPFPAVCFVATGGLDAANADAFLAAGVSVVGVGSALQDSAQIARLAELLS
jgi:Entner-Doudoroff aldolase